jgi:hypothetical protein
MNPNVKYQQATNLTLSYFMQDSQKLAFTNEGLYKGAVTTKEAISTICHLTSFEQFLINPYNRDDHLGKSICQQLYYI